MKRNVLLIPFIAVLTLFVAGFASAGLATGISTDFNGVTLGSNVIVGNVNNVVPIRVTFNSISNASDVRVKVYTEGSKDAVSTETGRFNIEDGVSYTKLLSLKLPSENNYLSDRYTLYVDVISRDDRSEKTYTISMQRNSYTFKILSTDYSSKVSAGEVFPISVVVKNTGYDRMDDTYVVASIPALGISTRGYVGDLIPTEKTKKFNNDEDSVYRTVYLKIPSSVASGIYEMEIEAYNNDANTTVKKLISVGGSASTSLLATVKNQDLKAGETATYNLVVVNAAKDVKVFNLKAVSGNALTVSVPSVITVGPDATKTIPVTVTASDDAKVGTYTFSVDVNGKQTAFSANVVSGYSSSSTVALTAILVIVFVVLFAVLIVLLTKKEKPIKEVETSYY